MRIGIFTDPHYSSQEVTCSVRYNRRSLKKIEQALDFFTEQRCDLVLCLGDLIDKEADHQTEIGNLKQIADLIGRYSLPFVCVMGNHDGFSFEVDEFYRILGTEPPTVISVGNNHLLFLDACHFANGNHYMPGDSDWTDTCYPDTDGLKATLDGIDGNVYVFIHQNIDPDVCEYHRLSNADVVRDILEQSGKVKAVYQGHYHLGNRSSHNGIEYITYPAMCQNDDAVFCIDIE